MTLSDKIQKLRQERKISQKDLAERINKSTADIALWESGESVPSLADIAAISSVFGVSTDYLILDNDNKGDATVTEHSKSNYDDEEIITKPKHSNKTKKRVWTIIIILFVLLLSAGGLLIFFSNNDSIILAPDDSFSKDDITLSFSKDTKQIEEATSSVVKIYCYDYDGDNTATGSGFIAFDNQTVVTNYHVLEEAYTCKISTDEDKTLEVSGLLAYSEKYDLAILKLKYPTGLMPLEFGDSNIIKKGETVTAIGSPLGLKNSVSQGVLSGRVMEEYMDVLQFTAAISSGSSGGALFDENGKVIGVTYASYIRGQNVNLAIPIELVTEVKKSISKSKALEDVSVIYRKTHPFISIYEEYNDSATEVWLSRLKTEPEKYNGKIIKLDTYISSKDTYDLFTTTKPVKEYYLSDKETVSGDYEFDQSAERSKRFCDRPAISIRLYDDDSMYDEEFEIGDNVIVIGFFDYEIIDEDDLIYQYAYEYDRASLYVYYIHKK